MLLSDTSVRMIDDITFVLCTLGIRSYRSLPTVRTFESFFRSYLCSPRVRAGERVAELQKVVKVKPECMFKFKFTDREFLSEFQMPLWEIETVFHPQAAHDSPFLSRPDSCLFFWYELTVLDCASFEWAHVYS